MKNLLTLMIFVIVSGSMFAQNITEQSIAPQGSAFTDHFKDFSWLYISAFVLLVALFVTAYFLGWDKKLFKTKSGDDTHLFI